VPQKWNPAGIAAPQLGHDAIIFLLALRGLTNAMFFSVALLENFRQGADARFPRDGNDG
jgi:hypothetical protein